MEDDSNATGTLQDTARLFEGPLGIRSLALTGLFILALFYTLYFARDIFLPVILAILLNFLLAPLVRGLTRIHIPEPVGAGVVLIVVLASITILGWQLSGPISEWVDRAPEIMDKLSGQIEKWRRPVDKVTKVTEQVENMAGNATAQGKPGTSKQPQVTIKQTSLVQVLFNRTWNLLFSLAVLVILLYFLLASGDLFLRKLIKVLDRLADKKRAVQIARDIEDSISKYLVTVSAINACLGLAGAAALWALGMPTPILWGAMAGLFNFVPYLGALTSIAIFTLVATATFDSVGHALMVPASYLVIASIEGGFITPWIMGRRMILNPVVVFIGLIFWEWLWGIPGALLAVPILVITKIFCDHIEPLAPIGEFLGQ